MTDLHRRRSAPRASRSTPKRGSALPVRIVALLLLVSLVPLGLLAGGAWFVFGQLLEAKSLEVHREVVRSQSAAIDGYLRDRKRALSLVAHTNRLADLADQAALATVFAQLVEVYDESFVDLGVIDRRGRHLAYVGPYDLTDKNYAEAEWFAHVMAHGTYVSDVFLGFREVPHCVIAVRVEERPSRWILRATINSAQLDALVRTEQMGTTAEAFLVNRAGVHQTSGRHAAVLDPAVGLQVEPHQGLRTGVVDDRGRATVLATAWVNDGRWMLVVRQSAAEIRAPLHRALTLGAGLMALAVLLVVATTVLATWHLTRQIDHAIAERDQLSRELLRSAQLASLGELATGLAHEINNPLAIISSERTNIGDCLSESALAEPLRNELEGSLGRVRRQIERCSGITSKMLRFGRKHDTSLEAVKLEPRLREIERLLKKQAAIRNVRITVEADSDLPPVLLDPDELEQVLVNLLTNSLQAMDSGGHVHLRAAIAGDDVVLTVADDGAGIEPGHLERIFQPFFTTKPVGQGTGLGLAVCYGLVRGWGGRIEAESEPGEGTTMVLHLPTVPRRRPRATEPQPRESHVNET